MTTTKAEALPTWPNINPLGWEAVDFPEDVAAWNEVIVWTGAELVLWGGEDATSNLVPMGEPGMAYSFETGMWRRLPPSPLRASVGATGVWTGTEIILCCGRFARQAAAYDPISDSWTALPNPPVSGPFAESVWTGTQMLVVTQEGVAAYDPSDDRWREFPESPVALGRTNEVAWTGSELIVWPSNVERRTYAGLALDLKMESWRVLPDPPAWPAAVDIVFTGDTLIIWGGLPAHFEGSERAVGSKLDLDTNKWTELPEAVPEPDHCECNLGSQSLAWMGDFLLVVTGYFGSGVNSSNPLLLGYDPTADNWSFLAESPAGWHAELLLAGEHVLLRSDRLFVSPPGWRPNGIPVPPVGPKSP